MGILGNRVVRTEDPRLLTGRAGYVDNVKLDGCLHVAFVGSTIAHAAISDVDVSAAAVAPGVVGVYTSADIGIPDLPSFLPADVVAGYPGANAAMLRPLLAHDRVRFVGEPVVAVLAESREAAIDARELVQITYERLPVVVDPERALDADAALLFEGAGTNLVCEMVSEPDHDVFGGADVVVHQRIVNQRVAPVPMETRTGAAVFADGKLTFYASTQGPSGMQQLLAMFTGLAPENVRVVAADVGGGFGAKGLIAGEELIVAVLAMRTGRPVKWVETRLENMLGMPHGRAQVHEMSMGATRDGHVVGVRLDVIQDCGAYPNVAPLLPMFTWLMMTGPYDIANVAFRARAVLTNTGPVGAFRGAGRPEATFSLERGMDLLAAELGIDAAEIRRRNLLTSDRFPYATPSGALYDSANHPGTLDAALVAAGYGGLRAEQAERRGRGDTVQLGIGLSTYVEITNPIKSPEPAIVRVELDGSATVFTGSGPHGQGHETSWAMIAADRLGIPMSSITVVYGDTDRTPAAAGTGGSRSAQTSGAVVAIAAEQVVERATQIAADALEAAVEDVRLDTDNGTFGVVGTPTRSVTWETVMNSAGQAIEETAVFEAGPSFPFGCHIAVVEVDTETGVVTVRQFVAVDDCGTILNPLLVEGQVHGGAAQGIAQALLEHMVYDEDGNPITSTFAEYMLPSAAELPSFDTVEHETPSPNNALGAKGVGESGTIGSTPAVASAVVDALSPFGIRHIDMPLSPRRIWEAINSAQHLTRVR
ncbi:MAG: aerobic carbon-monoxide dehydrogenase large subunit [Acidimicrobiaceae bacterium]|nr:aerobic carbon-monoxide dehydrogenase large subunit [Acidimicrobiaceae bacterium]